jgi:phosphoglycolate phosphatase-like HAD superfamily hydrolase
VSAPAALALDFDGVLCDGRPEYFEAARRAYLEAWPGAHPVPDAAAATFAAYRPLVESGWEMPLLLHAVVSGVPAGALVDRAAWLSAARRLLATAGVQADTLGRTLNAVRDTWFARDPDDWVRHNAFYPGVTARLLAALDERVPVMIVTTKAERFARALLGAQDARLASLPIVGREPGRTVAKSETLGRIAAERGLPPGGAGLWFVEDLLETLHAVHATSGLERVRLFLASWGYNTLEQRASVGTDAVVRLVSLATFAGPFAGWPR